MPMPRWRCCVGSGESANLWWVASSFFALFGRIKRTCRGLQSTSPPSYCPAPQRSPGPDSAMRLPFVTRTGESGHLERRKGTSSSTSKSSGSSTSKTGSGTTSSSGKTSSSKPSSSSTPKTSSVPLTSSTASGKNSATAYGTGGGSTIVIPAGQIFAGRSAGGGWRRQVYGTRWVFHRMVLPLRVG